MITEESVNDYFRRSASILNNEQDIQTKKIILQMLFIDWIFKSRTNGSMSNFGDLVKVLAKAPESVLNTDLVKKLVQNFYKDYKYKIVSQIYVPYVVYFVAILHFFSIAIDHEHHSKLT